MADLLSVKKWLDARLGDGVVCPVCDRFAKEYHRPLGTSMVVALILIYRASPTEYVKIADVLTTNQNADAAKLRYWNLLEPLHGTRKDGSNRVGFWRLTDDGRAFVRGEKAVPSHARMYNKQFLGLDGDLVYIHQRFDSPFDYDELMFG